MAVPAAMREAAATRFPAPRTADTAATRMLKYISLMMRAPARRKHSVVAAVRPPADPPTVDSAPMAATVVTAATPKAATPVATVATAPVATQPADSAMVATVARPPVTQPAAL
jgi:hypothetical protein